MNTYLKMRPIILKLTFLSLLTSIRIVCFAQLNDNFSDGNFTSVPQWSGNTSDFIINNEKQLQLHATEEGSSTLRTPSALLTNTEWEFRIKLSFSPSSNNNARVYLCSNDANQTNACFLQFGESGSQDAIELFRKQGNNIVSICRGTEGMISSSFDARIKVKYTPEKEWKLYADFNGGSNFALQANAYDNFEPVASFFAIECNYTSSNTENFYFDDFIIQNIIPDTTPPYLIRCSATDENSVELVFNETILPESAEILNNYLLKPLNKHPVAIQPDWITLDRLILDFDINMENGCYYTLQVDGIKDTEGNMMTGQSVDFSWFKPLPFDIVINEIMADPTPKVALPEYEYIELANNTDFEVDLKNWKLYIGNSEKTFGDVAIKPGSFLILAKNNAEEQLGILGDFHGFSSFSLSNAGQELRLYDDNMKLISEVSYTENWYKDPYKNDGGYSIEQTDRYNPCCGSSNWRASVSITGGTPGEENSVFELKNELPVLKEISFVDRDRFNLVFSHIMDTSSVLNPNSYEIDHSIGNPDQAILLNHNPAEVQLILNQEIAVKTTYTLSVTDTLFNCSGLPLFPGVHHSVGIPERAEHNDLVINEILFNPLEGGTDYIELYNRSDKILDLSKIIIGSVFEKYPDPNDTITAYVSCSSTLLFPGEYLLLSANTEAIKNQYLSPNPENFRQVDNLPAFNNDCGIALIMTEEGLVDYLNYDEKMHFPLLNYFKGVSLERLNFNKASSEIDNWHSASEASGFGTPGYRNSQYTDLSEEDDPITTEPEIFSPDGDGYHDLLNIHYNFQSAGNTVSVLIFDTGGNIVRTLINNELCGTRGFFSWDGFNENNKRMKPGIYIVLVKTYNAKGETGTYKKTGVLAIIY